MLYGIMVIDCIILQSNTSSFIVSRYERIQQFQEALKVLDAYQLLFNKTDLDNDTTERINEKRTAINGKINLVARCNELEGLVKNIPPAKKFLHLADLGTIKLYKCRQC